MKKRKNGGYTCTKTQALKIHTKRRAPERYDGAILSRNDIRAIAQNIKDGKGVFLKKQSNRVTEWEVSHNNILWRVLYDKNRHVIITCLPPRRQV